MTQTTVKRFLPLAISIAALATLVWVLRMAMLSQTPFLATQVAQTSPEPAPSIEPVVDAIPVDQTVSGQSNQIYTVAISPDARMLVSGVSNDTIKLWDLDLGTTAPSLVQKGAGNIDVLAVSPDGRSIASSGWGSAGAITTWHLDEGKLHFVLPGTDDRITALVFSPDNEHLVSGSANNVIKLWHWHEGELVKTVPAKTTGGISALAISADGKLLASGGRDGAIEIRDLDKGTLLRTLTGHTDRISTLTFSPDGKTLISGSADHGIRIWNLTTGKLASQLTGHANEITAVMLRSDGKTLASASLDGTVKQWDARTGKLLRSDALAQYANDRLRLAIAPSNHILVSGHRANVVKLWRIP